MKPIRIYWEKDFDEGVKGRSVNIPVNTGIFGGDISITSDFEANETITGIKVEDSHGKIWVRIYAKIKR